METVRCIHDPLAEGPSLLLLPESILLRWPANKPLPPIGSAYAGAIVDLSTATQREKLIELVKAVICGRDPLARCDASRGIPPSLLAKCVHYKTANQLRHVAQNLCGELRAQHGEQPFSLRKLIRASYGSSPDSQRRRLSASSDV